MLMFFNDKHPCLNYLQILIWHCSWINKNRHVVFKNNIFIIENDTHNKKQNKKKRLKSSIFRQVLLIDACPFVSTHSKHTLIFPC